VRQLSENDQRSADALRYFDRERKLRHSSIETYWFSPNLSDSDRAYRDLFLKAYSRTELEGRCVAEYVQHSDDLNSRLKDRVSLRGKPNSYVSSLARFLRREGYGPSR